MVHTLHHADAEILIDDTNGDKNKITVKLTNNNVVMPYDTWETAYPINLIKKILSIKGPAYLCDAIMRDESPEYVEKYIRFEVLGYINPEQFKEKSILDFGCGSSASTIVLNRMFPDARITGFELESSLLEIAELRASHFKVSDRVKFYLSPDGNSLPKDIGDFDFIFLNAVYEHLLPQERKIILPMLWRHLKPNGILFINQTPHRWFPIERHTSGLVFINYLPDFIASYYARRFSKRNLANNSWTTLLRKGIRGGSVGEIIKILKNNSYSPNLLSPTQLGLKDRIDIWYAVSNKSRYLVIKKCLLALFKLINISTGQVFLPNLAIAIKKPMNA
jgi:2-polyprenyl-3-methyl-5-hydroxy-6-metoxy-1,4-benzoquinol methylase